MPPSEIQKIKESYYQFTESDEEVREVRQIRQLCVLLNKHTKRYENQILFPNYSLISSSLGLQFDIENHTFSEDIETIRIKLAT